MNYTLQQLMPTGRRLDGAFHVTGRCEVTNAKLTARFRQGCVILYVGEYAHDAQHADTFYEALTNNPRSEVEGFDLMTDKCGDGEGLLTDGTMQGLPTSLHISPEGEIVFLWQREWRGALITYHIHTDPSYTPPPTPSK
jgi:hypothetical protein